MKIGILTFHYSYNYGAVLQCYAMQQYLGSLGHDAEVINFCPTGHMSMPTRLLAKLRTISSAKDLLHNLSDAFKVQKGMNAPNVEELNTIREVFNNFRQRRLHLSPKVDERSLPSLGIRYDAVVVGSDQVWTSLYGNLAYFLDWLSEDSSCRRIAYAACSAHAFVKGSRKKRISELIDCFDAVGVRDTTTKDLVTSLNTGASPVLVADPTLLYDFKDFPDSPKPDQPYILAYILGTEIPGGHEKALVSIRERYGKDLPLKAIVLPGSSSGIEMYAQTVIKDASPEEWVNLIHNATALYTDSFHGIMFAMKFGISFVAYYANAIRASRLLDLKQRFPDLPIYDKAPDSCQGVYLCSLDNELTRSKNFIETALGHK